MGQRDHHQHRRRPQRPRLPGGRRPSRRGRRLLPGDEPRHAVHAGRDPARLRAVPQGVHVRRGPGAQGHVRAPAGHHLRPAVGARRRRHLHHRRTDLHGHRREDGVLRHRRLGERALDPAPARQGCPRPLAPGDPCRAQDGAPGARGHPPLRPRRPADHQRHLGGLAAGLHVRRELPGLRPAAQRRLPHRLPLRDGGRLRGPAEGRLLQQHQRQHRLHLHAPVRRLRRRRRGRRRDGHLLHDHGRADLPRHATTTTRRCTASCTCRPPSRSSGRSPSPTRPSAATCSIRW